MGVIGEIFSRLLRSAKYQPLHEYALEQCEDLAAFLKTTEMPWSLHLPANSPASQKKARKASELQGEVGESGASKKKKRK